MFTSLTHTPLTARSLSVIYCFSELAWNSQEAFQKPNSFSVMDCFSWRKRVPEKKELALVFMLCSFSQWHFSICSPSGGGGEREGLSGKLARCSEGLAFLPSA